MKNSLEMVDFPHVGLPIYQTFTPFWWGTQDSDEAAFAMLNRATAQLQQNRPRPPGLGMEV